MLCSPNTDWFSPPPPLPHPPLFPLFSLFSPLCRGPKPAKHISKWQLLRLSSKKPRLVDFPRLMWHLWPRNRVEGERWGPMAQWWFVWGGGGRQGRGQESECERTLAVSRLIQDHWFPASFFLPPGHDLHCKWQFCRIGLFSGVRKDCGGRWGWAGGGDRGFPQHTGLLDSINSHPSLKKKKKKNPPLHSSSPSPSPCPRIPPQLPLQSPRTSLHYWGKHNRLIVLQRGGLDNSAAPRCIVSPNKPHKV